jgi:hypothetical protein
LKALGEQCATTLRIFKLSGASRVSDVGMRCVGVRAANLVELDLSSCLGLSGVGLASFGECSNGLVKLTLANCQNLEGWAFQRLVCSCHFLEEVRGIKCASFKRSMIILGKLNVTSDLSYSFTVSYVISHSRLFFQRLYHRWTFRSATS